MTRRHKGTSVATKHEAEERLRLVARARNVMAECNRVLLRAAEEQELLQEMCRIGVESGGYRAAWIGLARHDPGKTIEVVAKAGDHGDYFESVKISWVDDKYGRGPAGTAVRTGTPQVTQHVASDTRFRTWRDEALARGYRAVAALPLGREGQTFGVFGLFSSDADAFGEDEIALLVELANDIAYGIYNLRTREAHRRAEAEVNRSEERFRTTFNLAPVGLNQIDPEGRILLANPRFGQILGYAPEELVGRSIREFVWSEDKAAATELRARRADLYAGKIHSFTKEIRYRHKNGSAVWVRLTIALQRDTKGNPLHDISTIEDITARKREERLLALEHSVTRCLAEGLRASAALEAVSRAICESEGWDSGRYFYWDNEGGVLRFGGAWGVSTAAIQEFIERSRELVFRPGEGLAGRVWQSKQPLWVADVNDDARALRTGFARELGIRGTFVFPVASEGKTIGVLAFSSGEIRQPEERLLGAVGVIGSQIGQYLHRIRAEEELRRFRVAMDTSADMILLVERTTMRYVDVNNTVCKLLGYSREELLKMGPQDLLPIAREDLERAHDELIADPGIHTGMRTAYRCKDGSLLPAELTRAALPSGDTNLTVVIARDIRKQLAAEEALRASEERFRSLTDLSSDMYWEQDDQYRFTSSAGSGPDWLIQGRREGVGRRRWDFKYDNMTERGWTAHIALLDARKPFRDLELCRVDESRRKVWISVSGEPVFDASGAFRGYRGVGKDITARKRAEELQALEHAVNRSLADADGATEAVQAAIRAICESEGWGCGRYFRWEEKAGLLRFSGGWSVPGAAMERFIAESEGLALAPGVGLAGRVWEANEPVWVPDITKDSRAARLALAHDAGMKGAFVFPVVSEGKPIGVLAFNSHEVREPQEGLLRAIRVIGSEIGQFLRRKQTEEDLRRFRAAMDVSADMIWLIDPVNMRIVDVNNTACRALGYTRQEVLKMGPHDIVCTPREELSEIYRRLIAGDVNETTVEGWYKHKDGSVLRMESFRRVVPSAEGTVIVAVGRDITERRRHEEELRRFRLAMDNSADMIVLIDRATMRFVDVNATACNLLGYSREEMLEMGPQDLLPVSRADLERSYDELIADPSMHSGMNTHYRCKDGSVLPFESTRRVLRSGDTHIIAAISRDIRERIASEAALKQSNERFNTAVRATSDIIWDLDLVTESLWWNENFTKVFGYPREDVDRTVKSWYDATHPDDRDRVVAGMHRVIDSGGESWSDEYRFRRQDGSYAEVLDRGHVIRDGAGKAVRMIGAMADITSRKEAEEKMRNQALRQRLIAEFGQQVLASTDLGEVLKNAVELVSVTLKADFCNVLELDPEGQQMTYKAVAGWPWEWVGRRTVPLEPGGHAEYTLRQREPLVIGDHQNETRFAPSPLLEFGIRSSVHAPILGTPGAFGVLGVHSLQVRSFTDEEVTFLRNVANILAVAIERKSTEERLAHLAQFDPLTGLPNRHLFHDRLEQTMAQARRSGHPMAVLFIDLDRFKLVNDTQGHGAGDKLLKEAAARLTQCVRSGDTVGRFGGDEFGAILSELAKPGDTSLVAQKIIDALAQPFHLEGQETYVSASVGITLFPADSEEAGALITNADAAMYRAKEQGRNNYQYFTSEMNERALARVQMEAALRRAIERKEFLLHYQPKVDLASGSICGFEALLRWNHPERGMVSPVEFIPVLEDAGLIVPVGEWVLREVCEQILAWRISGLAASPVAVNLSARQFQQKDLESNVRLILQQTGVDPSLIQFELTESLLMKEPEAAARTLRGLKELGVKISVDDFGTGYSSLAYLKRFPIDALKIDRAFVRDITTNPEGAAITLAIIGLAHSLKLKVVAEGVETEGQLNFLSLHDCDEMQGFYFSKPVVPAECEAMLRQSRRLSFANSKAPAKSTVLLLDDSEGDLALLEEILRSDGSPVLKTTNPKRAFELLASRTIGIVVSDQNMPGLTGVEFLSHVKKLYPDVIRILATGSDDLETLTDGVNEAGIHKFLLKGWNGERLRAELREVCRRHHPAADAQKRPAEPLAV